MKLNWKYDEQEKVHFAENGLFYFEIRDLQFTCKLHGKVILSHSMPSVECGLTQGAIPFADKTFVDGLIVWRNEK